MKPQLLIDSTKYIKQIIPYAITLWAVYQLGLLGSLGLIQLFSWTQVIADTFIILPLLLIVVAIYFSWINSIKQYLQWDYIEAAERAIFACLVLFFMFMNWYESLRLLLLGFSTAIVIKYTTETILIDDEAHVIWYTKFYDKALTLMPFICTIILIILWLFIHENQFSWLSVCTKSHDTCVPENVKYMNNEYIVTETHRIYPQNEIKQFMKI